MRNPWTRLGCYACTVVLGLCGLTITLSSLSAHAQPVGTTALYRLWNGRDHFYTTGCDEKWTAVRDAGYVLEGIQAYIATQHTSSTTPLFRMFHPNGDHFYTASAPETEFAKTLGYHSEGVAGFVSPTQIPGTTPLFRMYNLALPDHFYTTNAQERDSAKLNGWSDEGIAGYVWATGAVTCPKFPMRFIARDGEHVGAGHHMTTELTVSENGRLDSITTTDNRVALNGFCGNVSFYFLDGNGNVLGEFGMPRDHQWCVDGSGVPLRPSKRTDRMTQMVPKEVLDKTAAVSILHIETSGKNALRDNLSFITAVKQALQ